MTFLQRGAETCFEELEATDRRVVLTRFQARRKTRCRRNSHHANNDTLAGVTEVTK